MAGSGDKVLRIKANRVRLYISKNIDKKKLFHC